MSRQTNSLIAALASAALTLAPLSPAIAGGMGDGGGGYSHGGGSTPDCPNMGGGGGGSWGHNHGGGGGSWGGGGNNYGHGSTININKNINIFKPVVIDKNININKNVNIDKNVVINKNIVINKVNAFSSAEASAFATAASAAQSGASSQTIVYSGSYQIVNNNYHGAGGAIAIAAAAGGGGACHMQEASVVKSIHAVCVSYDGREFPASHMVGDTWIDTAYEGEIARCIPGSRLKIVIGDVLQSDQGMAGIYEHGQVLMCADHEALRHFKDGLVKCAPAVPVPDCTERTNLRRYGTGDFFFSYRTQVCVTQNHTADTAPPAELGGLSLDGGVGDSSGN